MVGAASVDRFGPEDRRARVLPRGIDDTPLVTTTYAETFTYAETLVERTFFPFTSASLDLLLAVVARNVTTATKLEEIVDGSGPGLEVFPIAFPVLSRSVHVGAVLLVQRDVRVATKRDNYVVGHWLYPL